MTNNGNKDTGEFKENRGEEHLGREGLPKHKWTCWLLGQDKGGDQNKDREWQKGQDRIRWLVLWEIDLGQTADSYNAMKYSQD